jgi:hypothetical protein
MNVIQIFVYFKEKQWDAFFKKYGDETGIKIKLSEVIDAFIKQEMEKMKCEHILNQARKV